ncbi:MAG: Lrp/AsnC ligand binding domain-containing protein, partial [Alphaproteobacteria bacterium]
GMIFIYRHDRMRGAEVIEAVRRIQEVVACDVLSGEFDLVVRVEAPDADRIRSIWQEIAAIPGVRDMVTTFVLSSLIER